MTYISDFKENKTYNYKTYSSDGKKVLREKNVKYLFSYASKYSFIMYNHYLDRPRGKFSETSMDFFGNKIDLTNIRKSLNDKRCRWILTEEETITYTVTGRVFSKTVEVKSYDKSTDITIGMKVTPLDIDKTSRRYRTLYKSRVDKENGKGFTSVYVPGAMVGKPINMPLTHNDGFEVKMFDSLTIKDTSLYF